MELITGALQRLIFKTPNCRIFLKAHYPRNSKSVSIPSGPDKIPTVTRSVSSGKYSKLLALLVDAVGIEPTTCRLRALHSAPPPATIGCYKLLSFVEFTSFSSLFICYWHLPNYD